MLKFIVGAGAILSVWSAGLSAAEWQKKALIHSEKSKVITLIENSADGTACRIVSLDVSNVDKPKSNKQELEGSCLAHHVSGETVSVATNKAVASTFHREKGELKLLTSKTVDVQPTFVDVTVNDETKRAHFIFAKSKDPFGAHVFAVEVGADGKFAEEILEKISDANPHEQGQVWVEDGRHIRVKFEN